MQAALELDGPVRAVAHHPDARPSRTWSAGRECETDGCRTRLSIYNGSSECSIHQEVRRYVARGGRRRR